MYKKQLPPTQNTYSNHKIEYVYKLEKINYLLKSQYSTINIFNTQTDTITKSSQVDNLKQQIILSQEFMSTS